MSARGRAGFTLIESIVVILVTALVGSVLAITFVRLGDDWRSIQTRKTLERDVWGAVERLRRDVQRLRSATLEDVLVWTPSDFQFRDASTATLRYRLVGSQLERNGIVLLDGVQTFAISYWTATSAAATRIGDVRRLVVTVQASRDGQSYSVRTEIAPRSATYPFAAWSES